MFTLLYIPPHIAPYVMPLFPEISSAEKCIFAGPIDVKISSMGEWTDNIADAHQFETEGMANHCKMMSKFENTEVVQVF